MCRFISKPVSIRAIRWNGRNEKDLCATFNKSEKDMWVSMGGLVVLSTIGCVVAQPGDYITLDSKDRLTVFDRVTLFTYFDEVVIQG